MIAALTPGNRLISALAFVFIVSLVSALATGLYALMLIPFIVLLAYSGYLYPPYLFYLLLFLLPFSFEYNFSNGLGTDIPDEPLMWLVCLVFIAACLPKRISYFRKIIFHPLLIITGSAFFWILFSVAFSVDWMVSLKYMLAKSWYLIVFVLAALYFFESEKRIVMAGRILLFAMTIVVLIILLRQIKNGFSFAFVNEAAFPFFRNHVNYGAMLVCMIPVAYALSRTNSGKRYSWSLISKGYTAVLILFVIALVFTYSRGAWVALPVGMAAWWLIKQRWMVKAFLLAIILSVILFAWLKTGDRYLDYAHDYKTTIFHKDFSKHLISTYKLKDLSTEERFYRWIAAIRMVNDNWLSGTGPNTFYPVYKEYAVPAFKTYVSDNPEHSTVHNYFLLMLVEQGVPGLLLFILLATFVFYYVQKNYHNAVNRTDQLIALTAGTVFAMILVLNFLSDLIETDKIGSLYFLCIAVLVGRDRDYVAR